MRPGGRTPRTGGRGPPRQQTRTRRRRQEPPPEEEYYEDEYDNYGHMAHPANDLDHLSAANMVPFPGMVITSKRDQRLLKLAFFCGGFAMGVLAMWQIVPKLIEWGFFGG